MRKDELSYFFHLSNISEEGKGKLLSDIENILKWVSGLITIPLPEIEHFYLPSIELKRRNDKPEEFDGKEDLLNLGPSLANRYFKVPKVL